MRDYYYFSFSDWLQLAAALAAADCVFLSVKFWKRTWFILRKQEEPAKRDLLQFLIFLKNEPIDVKYGFFLMWNGKSTNYTEIRLIYILSLPRIYFETYCREKGKCYTFYSNIWRNRSTCQEQAFGNTLLSERVWP